jgi:hypothetical protein
MAVGEKTNIYFKGTTFFSFLIIRNTNEYLKLIYLITELLYSIP